MRTWATLHGNNHSISCSSCVLFYVHLGFRSLLLLTSMIVDPDLGLWLFRHKWHRSNEVNAGEKKGMRALTTTEDLVYHSLAERLSVEFAALRPSLSIDQVNTILLVHLFPETAVQASSLFIFRVLFPSIYDSRKKTANDGQENLAVFRGERPQIASKRHTSRTRRKRRYHDDIHIMVLSWRASPMA
ncbi:hypothetical protein EDD18DRAFT_1177050 [Armillaria luteobubalina]|uniref:Uncharacterized protein n=1 Tax=Armillaria luteobubalina TaxID=153913 RepID=A0AA39Q236_9AGAR|nr:hypothetical protein EDD18DRAFT_1177050 [Armillaria luteobubalina]